MLFTRHLTTTVEERMAVSARLAEEVRLGNVTPDRLELIGQRTLISLIATPPSAGSCVSSARSTVVFE